MNKARRSKLEQLLPQLYSIQEDMSMIAEEERNAFEALPENFQYSEKGERMEEIAEGLEEIADNLLDMTTQIEELMN